VSSSFAIVFEICAWENAERLGKSTFFSRENQKKPLEKTFSALAGLKTALASPLPCLDFAGRCFEKISSDFAKKKFRL